MGTHVGTKKQYCEQLLLVEKYMPSRYNLFQTRRLRCEAMTQPEIYEKLKQLRKERGLTLNTLAEKIGTDYQQISRIERGKSRLTIDVLMKIAEALETPIHNIVDGATEQKSESNFSTLSAVQPTPHEILADILEKIEQIEHEQQIKLRPQIKASLTSLIYTQILEILPTVNDAAAVDKLIDFSITIVKTIYISMKDPK